MKKRYWIPLATLGGLLALGALASPKEEPSRPTGIVDVPATTTAMVTSTVPPTTTTALLPATTAATSAPPEPEVYFTNCAEARSAGAAPIEDGEPGYRSALDGDGDGVACDS